MRPMLAALALCFAAQQQIAPRDPGAPAPAPPTGTGIIRGRVVAADTGTPIRGALVTISGAVGRGRGTSFTIYADAQGRYEAKGLAAGAYVVSARPNQYQGQFLPPPPPTNPSPDGPPRVTIADGQVVEGYDLPLPRAGAIVGRLVDENGDPVAGLGVQALRPGTASRSDAGGYFSQSSDEFGRYRISHLTPGEYLVMVQPFGGGDWVMQGKSLGFVNTYYPGTYSREEAARVRVRAGQETASGDLQLTRTAMLRVKGTVLDSHGAPPPTRAMVSLVTESTSHGVGLGPDGRFSFQPQPPGAYYVVARMTDESGESTLEYARVPVRLVDADLEDVAVAMKPTVTLTGRVVFEGGVPATLAASPVSIRGEQRDRADTQPLLRAAAVTADLTFTLRRVAGELLLRPNNTPGGWILKTVLLGSQDITDVPTDFRAEDSNRIQIVLTNRTPEVSGAVTGDKGQPVTNCVIVIFAEDRAFWFVSSTRVKLMRPGRDARYTLRGLPAGRYYAIALPPDRAVYASDVTATLLDSFIREATAFVLGDDEQRVVDLKLVSAAGGL